MRTVTFIIVICALLTVSASLHAVDLPATPLQDRFAAMGRQSGLSQPVYLASNGNSGGLWGDRGKPDRKSVGKALLYSALLPGMGEYYVGNRKKARYFFAVEAVSWLGFLSFHMYGNWKEDDYINFARARADARLEDKSDEFRDWVGFYDDIDQFNELGRVQDRDRPYLVDNESNHWRWRNRSDKAAYREIKNRSREAFRRRDFTIGLMIINRVVSVIDAVHDARKSRRLFGSSTDNDSRRFGYRLDIDPFSADQQVRLALLARF